ncbi:unnamed protein product [Didymodactylos carnosus]|uniref:Uncharacterized protein n=1 Tax=Didymodactylos carnosus TaxID=1234261 RepID=A0A815Q1B3_9BILA|nr:unnamed protein product [Didymodactylos carnosus]CAF4328648.1 unnamed protein product [Didymodactylos carnosus]
MRRTCLGGSNVSPYIEGMKFPLNENPVETKTIEKDLIVKFETQNNKLQAVDASIEQLKIQMEHLINFSQQIMKGLKISTEKSLDNQDLKGDTEQEAETKQDDDTKQEAETNQDDDTKQEAETKQDDDTKQEAETKQDDDTKQEAETKQDNDTKQETDSTENVSKI